MRRFFIVIIICLGYINCLCQNIEKKILQSLDVNSVHRIGDYGKLWAVLVLFHPNLAYNQINIDSLFTEPVKGLLNDPSAENFKKAIQNMINRLGDPYTSIENNVNNVTDTFRFEERTLLKWINDSVALLHFDEPFMMLNSSEFSPNTGLINLIDSLKNAKSIIIDLRESSPVKDEMLKYYRQGFVKQLISHLSDLPVKFPSYRTRIHYGHESQTFDVPYFYQGWLLQNSSESKPKKPVIKKPVCLIINKYDDILSDEISAMNNEGLAMVIAFGDLDKFEPVKTYQMKLADKLTINIRLSEVLYTNGAATFEPNAITDQNDNEVVQKAVQLLYTDSKKVNKPGKLLQNLFVTSKVSGYNNVTYPSAPLRLLGLMRFWTAINYFCPNKKLITKNWDSVLYQYIPKFLVAKDSIEYMLTAAKLIKEINDTHGFFNSQLNNGLIEKTAEVQLKYVESKTIIYKIFNDSLKKDLQIGDEVISIDGTPVNKCRDSIGRLIAASNEAALQTNINSRLLAGKSGSFAHLGYSHNGIVKTVTLPRKIPWYFEPTSTQPVWKKINNELGYVDFGRLKVQQIDSLFNDLFNTKAIIVDNRSYPYPTIWTLINYLTNQPVKAAKGITMIADSPDPLTITEQESIWELPVSPKRIYKGKIIILVNELTQSLAEYSCMIIQAATKNVTIIGSQTAGADGDVSAILLPGGIETYFTGHGVHYPDGRPTQGIGIIPDIKIKPTIKGIKSGKDEVLDRAIRFASSGK